MFSIPNYNSEKFPSFNKPEIVGYFSLNGANRLFSEDLTQLKFYNESNNKKKVHFDLNEGIDKVIRKPYSKANIDEILKWILNNHNKIRANPESNRWLRPEFISYRGLLRTICCTPFEDRDGWIICAAKFHGTIYLCLYDTEQQEIKKKNQTTNDLKFSSWGFKFEQFLLSDSPSSFPNTSEPVNEAEEFNCIFVTKLGQKKLLYGAEMDGICSKEIVKEPVNWKNLKFVELKTQKVITCQKQEETFRKKLLKWWCQSFLVGIENVIYGTRNNSGKVFELNTIKISDMPKMSMDFWNASHCMNFCDSFLNHLQSIVTRDFNESIYKFEYKLDNKISMQELPSSSEFSFLPTWYTKQVNEIISNQI